MAFRIICFLALVAVSHCASISNEISSVDRINSADELVSTVVNDCFHDEAVSCLKEKVLTYFDSQLDMHSESARSYDSENIDKVIFDRMAKLLQTREFKLRLPETVFQNAEISYRADKGLDIVVPDVEENTTGEARGVLKKKLLLPVLLLLKLKMKALMPILLAITSLKALKALILSKVAILVVVGFLVSQLLKKGGMAMPMMSMSSPPPEPYGAPVPPPSTPSSSYEPGWEPNSSSGSGPYSRVWEPSSAQSMAYSAYYPQSSSSSSSSSLGSLSSGSSSSSTY